MGSFEDTVAPEGSYVIANNLLYLVDSQVEVEANRAYIDMSKVGVLTGEVKGIALMNARSTAIQTVEADGQQTVIYDLQGRRVSNPAKGLYIVNGKKVVIK